MFKTLLAFVIICVFSVLAFHLVFADTIHLKDGTKIEGEIVCETKDTYVVKTKDGVKQIDKDKIAKIEKDEEKPEKKPKKDKKKPAKKKQTPKKKKSRLKGSSKKPKKTRECVRKTLEFLAKSQQGDGSWKSSYALPGKVVIAAVCGTALMASGSTPTNGRYSKNIQRALNYVMANFDSSGKAGMPGGMPGLNQVNWSLAIGGLFLAEAYATARSGPLKEKLKTCYQSIQDNQEPSGGWGHGPGGPCALGYTEMAVMSNWCLGTLGAARQQKFKVDKAKLEKAIQFIVDCTNADGGVSYSVANKGWSCPARAAGAIYAFSMLKVKSHPHFKRLANFFDKKLEKLFERAGQAHGSPGMGILQCALGSIHLSKAHWDRYVEAFFPMILDAQNPDGSFKSIPHPKEGDGDKMLGTFYSTGICALILQLDEGKLRYISGMYARSKK